MGLDVPSHLLIGLADMLPVSVYSVIDDPAWNKRSLENLLLHIEKRLDTSVAPGLVLLINDLHTRGQLLHTNRHAWVGTTKHEKITLRPGRRAPVP